MITQTTTRARCLYTKIEPNIHELVFTESSRRAVDEFIETLNEIIQSSETDEIGHTLMDTTVGFQPIAYIFNQIRTVVKAYPAESYTVNQSKLALICPAGPLVQGIDMMMRSFPMLRTRIFKADEREQALAWLRE